MSMVRVNANNTMKKIGLLAFDTGSMLFPMLIDTGTSMAVEKADALFGTACNVTGDGALAIMIERLHGKPFQ